MIGVNPTREPRSAWGVAQARAIRGVSALAWWSLVAAVAGQETTAEAFAAGAVRAGGQGGGESLVTSMRFEPRAARFVRLVIFRTDGGAAGIDEIEVRGPGGGENLALASRGVAARASSTITGHAIHAVKHLNDGLLGNDHSWIAGGTGEEWVELELPEVGEVEQVVWSRDRTGGYEDRQVLDAEARLSLDGKEWCTAGRVTRAAPPRRNGVRFGYPVERLRAPTWDAAVEQAFLSERETWSGMDRTDHLSPLVSDRPVEPGGAMYWGRMARFEPLERVLAQFGEMIERTAALGLDVSREREELVALRERAGLAGVPSPDWLYLEARHAKRRLFLRDPRLEPLQCVLFAKRHPYQPTHNYSEHMDGMFVSGGGIHVLRVPRDEHGRLDPARGTVEQWFDGSAGIVRDPVADFDAGTVYFAYRPERPERAGWQPYWRLMALDRKSGEARQLTDGPFHDFDPVPLPDGGVAFMSTRCHSRFLCWEPQAYVLHRIEADGSGLRRLSHANLSEWNPSVTRDGRILWTRSEYLDKGADFGHTLWVIRPDGTHPELVFGNDTPYGYGHAREVPGSREVVCTLISHGDHQGPIALIDPDKGRYSTEAITSITPDTRPQYQMDRSHHETFRDPEPVSRDHFLVSHNPGRTSHWCLYVIDRFGNRELLYADPAISSKSPSLLRVRERPPVLPVSPDPRLAEQGLGEFMVQDVYQGLGPAVARGSVRYLQVSQEIAAGLQQLATGEYRSTHPGFPDFYATPVHLLRGSAHSYVTATGNAMQAHAFRMGSAVAAGDGLVTVTERNGWPSYVAKAVLGTVPVAGDGSVRFTAPAGRVLYFQLLDGDFVEIQRMRSVVQLQPGEQRGCVGCHEDRARSASPAGGLALRGPAVSLEPPPWGAVPFDYQRVVQPVLDRHCVECHEAKPDLRGTRGGDRVPVSYRSLIEGGWVHYFDWSYGSRHFKAEPMSFGTRRSRLFGVLADEAHRGVRMGLEERRALTAWIDLNCPLWPDYRWREEREP